jgi:hypothetical protein
VTGRFVVVGFEVTYGASELVLLFSVVDVSCVSLDGKFVVGGTRKSLGDEGVDVVGIVWTLTREPAG